MWRLLKPCWSNNYLWFVHRGIWENDIRTTNTLDPGDIYLGINIISGVEVDIKLESVKAKHSQLECESKVYKTLAGGIGVPFVQWFRTGCDYNGQIHSLS
jgi:hypothetical protein